LLCHLHHLHQLHHCHFGHVLQSPFNVVVGSWSPFLPFHNHLILSYKTHFRH
jgi:hypothetical protein